jgi:hypothetical protein
MPPIDILIRSYYRDRAWLVLAVSSIGVFVRGYRRVIVVVPDASLARVDWRREPALRDVDLRACRDFPDDYVGQQITKLHADTYTDAEVILHLDSDNVFVSPCDLSAALFEQGKLRITFAAAGRPAADGWRRCASDFLRQDVPFDLTGPPPVAFRRSTYGALRRFCREAHGLPLHEYASRLRGDRLCEFAMLRGYALLHEPEEYRWADASIHDALPECRRFWSRAQAPCGIVEQLPPPLRRVAAAASAP